MKRTRIVIVAATVSAVASVGTAAGAAVLAGPIDSAGVIHGCYGRATASGSHQVVLQDAGRRCARGSKAISWNQTGRTGQKGATGPRGPQGPAGPGGLLSSQLMLGVGHPDVLSGSQYGFSRPDQVAFDGSHLWVANNLGDTVTVIPG